MAWGGGGFLIVPALVLFAHLPMKEAIGTSLFIMTINSGAGLLGHWHYGGFDLLLTLLVTSCAVLGTLSLALAWHTAVVRRNYG